MVSRRTLLASLGGVVAGAGTVVGWQSSRPTPTARVNRLLVGNWTAVPRSVTVVVTTAKFGADDDYNPAYANPAFAATVDLPASSNNRVPTETVEPNATVELPAIVLAHATDARDDETEYYHLADENRRPCFEIQVEEFTGTLSPVIIPRRCENI